MKQQELSRLEDIADRLTFHAGALEEAAPRTKMPAQGFRRLVVGTDGSSDADHALAWTAVLAKGFAAPTWVVSAITPPDVVDHYLNALARRIDPGPSDFPEDEEEAAQGGLVRAAAQLRGAGVQADTILTRGRPAEALAGVAKAEAADLIIVGSHGDGVVDRALLGSVADALKNKAETSLLIAKSRPSAKRILAATDGSVESKRAIAQAVALSQVLKAPLAIVHVVEPIFHVPFQGDRERYLRAVGDLDLGWMQPPAHVDVAFGDPAERLLAYAEHQDCGLIVLGARGLGGLKSLVAGSVSTKVAHRAKASVLLVKGGP